MVETEAILLGLTWTDLLTILAIVVGPILALVVSWARDSRRQKLDRRLAILRSLMVTRKNRTHPEHVGALNLVELEFYGVQSVIRPFRAYVDHLSAAFPSPDEQPRHFETGRGLFVDLMSAMGLELGYRFDKHDLERFSYYPTGWETEQNLQRQNGSLLLELLQGRRALPVAPMANPQQSPFPPPPQVTR